MFVQFHMDSDVLQAALHRAPGTEISVKHLDTSPSVPMRSVFWASGEDLDRFEEAVEADETVRSVRVVAENDGERLYRACYPESIPDVELYHTGIDEDGVFLKAESSGDGWTIKMLFPDRESFTAFRDACDDLDFTLDVDSIYSKPFSDSGDEVALTDPQRDLLTRAVEVGYFDIPRETTLQELGQQMDISGQAASERLRRGMETLIRETVTEEALERGEEDTNR